MYEKIMFTNLKDSLTKERRMSWDKAQVFTVGTISGEEYHEATANNVLLRIAELKSRGEKIDYLYELSEAKLFATISHGEGFEERLKAEDCEFYGKTFILV